MARAIDFAFAHAEEWGINTDGYSLWGGSAGARMAALGIPTEFHVYPGLGHGFGLGTGTGQKDGSMMLSDSGKSNELPK